MTKGSPYRNRAARLAQTLKETSLDGIMVVPGPNMRYLTGVESMLLERPFFLLVPTDGEAHLLAPELEAGPYRKSQLPMSIHSWTDSQGSSGAINEAVEEARVRGTWGVEGRFPFLYLDRLMKACSPKFRDAEPILQGLRELKDSTELRLLKRSAKILSKSFESLPELIRVGVSEMEIAKAATELIYSNGATKVDDMLVQSGPRAADPHSGPSSRKVRSGESVIIDVGATFDGYYADITRTLCLGKSTELEAVYGKVLEAEESAIRMAGEGVQVGKVDEAARGVLRRASMGKYFIHRTGHGLGLEVHEAPYIVEDGREALHEGMCFTIEPGVYMRGRLGVRIEDNVVVQGGKGVEITDPPKEFGWWR